MLDGNLEALTPGTKLARSARAVPVWVITSAESPHEKRAALDDLGVRVCVLDSIANRPSLDALMRFLADEGQTRLMVEGGPRIWRAFIERRLIDEAIAFVQLGGWTSNQPTFKAVSGLVSPVPMALVEQGIVGSDRYLRYERLGT